MMDFNERVIPDISANFLYKEALARYQFAKKFINRSKSVLDIGCGTGYGTSVISATGLDVDPEAISYARKHYPNTNFVVGSALKLPFADHKFDVVISFETIEHFPQTTKFLSEVKRVLRPKGLFILSTPNGKISSLYHAKYFTSKSLATVLKKHFSGVQLFGEFKSLKAEKAITDFMSSQNIRQNFVNTDKLGIRKFIPRLFKEKVWKYLGNHFYGRGTQEYLNWTDFPINKEITGCSYLVAICKK